MRSFRQILEGYGKCVHCGKVADGGWANGNDICKHHGRMERDIGGRGKKHRGHNAMPDATRRRMEGRLG